VRLYATLMRLSIADAIQYRVESAIYVLYELLPPIMMMFLWLTVYQDQSSVAGYALGEMLTYTVGVMVLRATVTVHVEWALDHEIRDGQLSAALIRPYDYWGFLLVDSLAWRMVRQLFVLPTLLGALYLLGPTLDGLSLPLERLPIVLLSAALGYVVCFFLKLCIGFIGFWTNEIMGITTLYEVIANVLGGILIPIALLPDWLQTIARLLPIQAIYSVPLGMLLGKGDGADPWWGIGLQLGWIVVLWGLARVLWRAGLRRYESVGG
jgi:ABC-2 type transport system permease protein